MSESSLSLDYAGIARNVFKDFLGGGEVYSTGTVTIASGVVTFTNATVPTWAADGVLEVSGVAYTVNTRDSSSQVTLDDTSLTVGSATAHVLFHATLTEWQQFKDVCRNGLKQFYSAHKWRFLRPKTTLTLNAAYSTGTVTVVDGVVTLASGTWPSWAASGEFNLDGIGYTVASRDSGSQLTLDDTSLDADAGSSYFIEQVEYTLPDDWAGMDGKLTYRPGDGNLYQSIEIVPEGTIRELRSRNTRLRLRRPVKAAIRANAHDATAGTRYSIIFDSGPDQACILEYVYRSRPNELTPTNKYPVGGPEHDLTILQAIRKRAEMELDNQVGTEAMAYMELLQQSIRLEGEETVPGTIGMVRDADGSGAAIPMSLYDGTVTFEGHTLVQP